MTSTAWLTRLDAEKDYIKRSIDNQHPVPMSVRLTKNGVEGGHLVLVDAYEESPTEGFRVRVNWGWQNVDGENDAYFKTDGPWAFSMTVKGTNVNWVVNRYRIIKNTVPISY